MGCGSSTPQKNNLRNQLNKQPEGYKVVLLGDVAVGKTSLLWRFVKSEFLDSHTPTVGLAYLQSTLELENKVDWRLSVASHT